MRIYNSYLFCCLSFLFPSNIPRTGTLLLSFTIIMSTALNTLRVSSGPMPWHRPHTPSANCSAIIAGIVGRTFAFPYALRT